MKFATCAWKKEHTIELTERRVKATARRLAKEREAVALIPDLVNAVSSLGADLAALKKSGPECAAEWRAHFAELWRRARRALEVMADQPRRGLLRYWNSWNGPSGPEFLLGFIHNVNVHKISYWTRMRELRQLTLIGQGRFPKERIAAVFAETKNKSGRLGRDEKFYLKRRRDRMERKQGKVVSNPRARQLWLVPEA